METSSLDDRGDEIWITCGSIFEGGMKTSRKNVSIEVKLYGGNVTTG